MEVMIPFRMAVITVPTTATITQVIPPRCGSKQSWTPPEQKLIRQCKRGTYKKAIPMTQNVVQIRMPQKLATGIERLVAEGLYKNRSEVVIDAVRHFLGSERKSNVALQIEEHLIGKNKRMGYSKEEIDGLWAKVRRGEEWKRRFGVDADEVMITLRSR